MKFKSMFGRLVAISVAGLVLVGVATAAESLGPAPSKQKAYSFCASKSHGHMRVVKINQPCRAKEFRYRWDFNSKAPVAASPGQKGEQGPQGANGKDGSNGTNGADGEEGPAGPAGADGAAGAQGPKGETGLQGPKGDKGDPGQQGPQGQTGPAGAQGAQGAPGPQGPVGPKGPKGDPGTLEDADFITLCINTHGGSVKYLSGGESLSLSSSNDDDDDGGHDDCNGGHELKVNVVIVP